MTSEELSDAYTCALDEQLGKARGTSGDTCRFCGHAWRPDSKLMGHAQCAVPLWFKEMLFTYKREHGFDAIVACLGVTEDILRAWISPVAERARSLRVPEERSIATVAAKRPESNKRSFRHRRVY